MKSWMAVRHLAYEPSPRQAEDASSRARRGDTKSGQNVRQNPVWLRTKILLHFAKMQFLHRVFALLDCWLGLEKWLGSAAGG
jgi:hypothetical protein